MSNVKEDYPGRWLHDSERSPLGLGWEYARRQWPREKCPLRGVDARNEFAYGYDHYICCDPNVDEAMLKRGVEMEVK